MVLDSIYNAMKRGRAILLGVSVLSAVCALSCSTNSVDMQVLEEPNLSGVWVDTIRVVSESGNRLVTHDQRVFDTFIWVSELVFDSGSFTLKVPDQNVRIATPEQFPPPFQMWDIEYHGDFKILADSIHLNYIFDSAVYPHMEPFRFELFDDSLILDFNSDAGIDSTIDSNTRDTLHLFGFPRNIRPPSLLWPYGSGRFAGVFRRVE